jgi:actin-related protein
MIHIVTQRFLVDTASLEMKQKIYGGIVMVGGGLAFPGAANLLQSRLEQKPLTIFPRTGNNIEVFTNPRVRVESLRHVVGVA